FFRKESCGQCTPCREGAGWLEKVLARIEAGHGRESDLDLLMDACDNIAPGLSWPPRQTTICPLGPSIPSSIVSAIRMFRDEFMIHVKEGGCPYAGCPSPPHRDDQPGRPPGRGLSRRGDHRRGGASGRVHPPVLLPPPDETGRRVPHVPRRP